MLNGRERRARPMDLGPGAGAGSTHLPHAAGGARGSSPIPDARVVPARRSGRVGRRARDDPARVRRRAAAPAAAPARGADPARGAALAGERGRRAARHERRRRSTARCSARGRRSADRTSTSRPRRARSTADSASCSPRYVDAFERYDIEALTALHPRGRDAVDAAVRRCGSRGRDDILTLVVRARDRLQRLARDPDRGGERLARVRPVQAEPGRRLRAVGAAGARALRRADRRVARSSSTPRRSSRSSACRPARRVARPPGRRTRSAHGARSRRGAAGAPARGRRAASWSRASASIVAGVRGERAATSQTIVRDRWRDVHRMKDRDRRRETHRSPADR